MVYLWFKKNKKLAFKLIGINFLLVTVIMLFWNAPKESLSENEKAAANVTRMEAQVAGTQTAIQPASMNLMKKHMKKQKEQLRILLVLMVIAGAGFVLYGFLKKEE
jgi:septal ring-binding cell division protein DamX